jgi:hypothetical protein
MAAMQVRPLGTLGATAESFSRPATRYGIGGSGPVARGEAGSQSLASAPDTALVPRANPRIYVMSPVHSYNASC